jgi:hypothetical protein
LRIIRQEEERVLAIEAKRIKDQKDALALEKRKQVENAKKEQLRLKEEKEAKELKEAREAQELLEKEIREKQAILDAEEKKPKTRVSRRKDKGDTTTETLVDAVVEKQPIQDVPEEKTHPVITVVSEEPPIVKTPEIDAVQEKKTSEKERQRELRLEKRRTKRISDSTVPSEAKGDQVDVMVEKSPMVLEKPQQTEIKLSPLKEKKRLGFGDESEVLGANEPVSHPLVELIELDHKRKKKFENEVEIDLQDEALEIDLKGEEVVMQVYTPEVSPFEKIVPPIIEKEPIIEKIDVTLEITGISDEERKLCAKRDAIIKEFAQTERTYVGDLHNMDTYYTHYLVGFLSDGDMKIIFDGFDDIVRVNDSFIVHLEDILYVKIDQDGTRERKIAQLMIDFSKEFPKYERFVLNFGKATNHIREMKKTNEKFKNFLLGQRQEVMAKTNQRHNDLNSILITPVQRLPRYRLLLQDLLRNISKTVPVGLYDLMETALDKTHQVTVTINERKKNLENRERLVEIVNNNELGIKGLLEKEYIKDLKGVHMKAQPKNVDCDLYLFTDCVVLKYASFLGGKKLIIMPLHTTSVIIEVAKKNEKSCFTIQCKDKKEKILFKNDPQRNEWAKDLNMAIEKVMNKK